MQSRSNCPAADAQAADAQASVRTGRQRAPMHVACYLDQCLTEC